jgi:hypothetical protein
VPLEKENPWAVNKLEVLTLEYERDASIYEHESFFHGKPQEPCSHNASPELVTLCAMSMYEDYNYLKILLGKIFKRVVVNVFVYHKFYKSCGCTYGTNLMAKTSMINQQLQVKLGPTLLMIAAT